MLIVFLVAKSQSKSTSSRMSYETLVKRVSYVYSVATSCDSGAWSVEHRKCNTENLYLQEFDIFKIKTVNGGFYNGGYL